MGKRVGVVLSGCGFRDGSEIREAVLALLSLSRADATIVCAAPDVAAPMSVDHRTGAAEAGSSPRNALAEAARIARGDIRPLAELRLEDVDALIFPGGAGVATVLSNYGEKGPICDVLPDVVRLLRGAHTKRIPMGFICIAPILAARVLGPLAGVRVTLGARHVPAAKHAAVMGADVRPCLVTDVMVDEKHRVVSTPAYMYDDAPLQQVAHAIERLVRTTLSLCRSPRQAQPPAQPVPARGSAGDAPRRPEAGPRLRRPGAAPGRS
jgi:enhancing lycopene biosynthesis protein 2